MTDIFQEVEEDVRRERLERLWKQYGDYIIAGVAVVVIAIAAYELWQRYETGRRQQASVEYDAAVQLIGTDPAAAATKLEALSKSAPSGYATLARFAEADALLVTGDRDKAVAIYKDLGSTDDGLIGNAARLRAAWSVVEFAPRGTVADLVKPLEDPASAWRFMALEVVAYADYRSGELAAANKEYQALADDKQAPDSVRARAKGIAALVKAGGIKDFGTVPPLKTPKPAANPASP